MTLQKQVKETNYGAAFRESLTGEKNEWLRRIREEAFEFFTENGFPVVQNEDWKYTNIASLANENFDVKTNSNFTSEKVEPFIFEESKKAF